MLILPRRSQEKMVLNAYSFSDQELDSLRIVLESSKIPFSKGSIAKDDQGRRGVTYSFDDKYIDTFSKHLYVEISGFEVRCSPTFGPFCSQK